ncbi:hypothetical protein [Microbacterium sp. cx-59]|uniref:hypothetical protein n=1 Tax=Microbacterium sp. cx-59 TaxID=2891207 RepID=UPI001E63B8A4|nr:hypothetical protein [Microbacterium sp. cx-59]MCC4908953.1 hypothetical protein [Microbacterium sp. cx-59]
MTDIEPPKWESAKDLKAFSDKTSPRVVELLDTSDIPVPRPVHQRAKSTAKSFSFTREVKLGELVEVVSFLAAYGRYHRLDALARTVARTPHTGNSTLYEPIRNIVHTATYFAKRRHDASTMEALDPHLFVPADFTRPAGYLTGEHLQNWLDLPAEKAEEARALPASYHAGMIADDLLTLASISVCGGSSVWTPDRIDAQVDRIIAGVFAVRGYAPPTS